MSTSNAAGPVLAVFAHPDDEILCGAGTLALCSAQGRPVTLACLTRGELGPIADATLATRETLAQVREGELRASCAALGIAELRVLELPDAGVAWAAEQRDTLSELVELVRTLRPALLITFGPDGLYGHSDHVAAGELMTAARKAAADASFQSSKTSTPFWIPRVFYPVITAEYVADLLAQLAAAGRPGQLWSLGPQHFHVPTASITASVDVSSVLERKLRALHCHRTQLEADNALALLSGELAARFLSIEHFRCADGLPGDPLTA
jgi:LmbE family N-acetylglucosaminyl deacetylase